MDLDEPVTESQSADGRELDLRSTSELVELANRHDAGVPAAVAAAAEAVAEVIDVVVDRLREGGRLVYVGAGSSGRQAAADAAECEATFSTAPGQVVAVCAGDEADEDDAAAGAGAVRALGVGPADAVLGVSAGGSTPYVLAALETAAAAGASTGCIVSTPGSPLAAVVEREICVLVGPELIAGSTRLKAGTAQKLVLNTISTVSMIRLSKVFDNLMVDVSAANEKLRDRARRIVQTVAGVGADEADAALTAAAGSAKVAILSLRTGLEAEAARAQLAASGGDLRTALGEWRSA